MSDMWRVVVQTTGPTGLPGYNTLNFNAADDAESDVYTALQTFWTALAADMSNAYTVHVPGTWDKFDSTTGATIGTTHAGSDVDHVGSVSQDFLPFATTLLIQWRTGAYFSGRELRGRSFISGFGMEESVSGLVKSTLKADVTTAASALTGHHLAVYSPTKHQWASVSEASVWSEWASLRSRRD